MRVSCFQCTLRSQIQIFALAAFLCMSFVSIADSQDEQTTRTPQNSESKEEPKCFHGCQRWGKLCNVDPRGVYKCRRTCEKFGEICD